jgi:hypothetical protein
VITSGSSGTTDLHTLPIVVFGGLVVTAGLGLGAIAGVGPPGVLVFLVVGAAGSLAYVGYRKGSGLKRRVLFSGSCISTVAALVLTAHPLWTVTPAPPDISISAERQHSCSTGYVFPGLATELPPAVLQSDPGFEKEWAAWGLLHKAADADRTSILINVSSADHRTITLTRLSVFVTQRRAARGVAVGYACGGATKARYIQYNLDAKPPRIIDSSRGVAFVGEPGVGLQSTPLTFPYTVTDEDTASILIIGSAYSCDCLWHAELSWQAGAAHGVREIDSDGQPFHTTGSNGLDSYYSVSGPWQSQGRVVKALP